MRRRAIAVLALLAIGASPVLAQQGTAGIQGRVLDESGGALPGVTVVVTNEASGIFRQVVSNDDGSYFVTGVLPGSYHITANLQGFKKYDKPAVVLAIGNMVTLNVELEVGGIEERVTVTGQAPLVDINSTQVGTNISNDELNALPILNRNWTFAVGLTPGVQVQSSTASFACESLIVGGGSNRSGNFSIDGGGNNDDYLGSSCGSQVRPALESIQEFQVLTNQYDAEFGRTAGAVINAVTKQGGNEFHGAVFDSYTNDKVTAPDFFVKQNSLTKPQTSQSDWGGTIGGPIVRNKAHFFYSLDRIVYAEGRSNTFAARPELDYSNTQRMKLWNNMIRVDSQINANNTWSAHYLEEDSPTYDRISGRRTLAARDQEYDVDRTAGGDWNTIFGNTRFNTVRLAYTHEKNGFTNAAVQGSNPKLMVDLPPTYQMLTFLDGTANGALFRIDDSYELSETFSQFVPDWGGEHDVKIGAQYIYSTIWLPDQTDMNGRFSFATDQAFDPSDPTTYPERLFIRVPAASNTKFKNHVIVGFAQDKWNRGNLTLNLGVRYDLEMTPMNNAPNPLFQPGEYPVDKNNIAPRTGFTWRPKGSQATVVRGGYGLFYDKVIGNTTRPFVSQALFSDSFTAAFPISQADPGPSHGQFPADPLLLDYANSGPIVNRDLVNAAYPPGSIGRNTGVVFLDNPDRQVPKTHQVSLGYERQLQAQMALTIDYVHSWNRQQLVNYDLNPATRANTSRTGPLTYHDLLGLADQLGLSAFRSQVLTRKNLGSSQFDGVNVSLEKRMSQGWAGRISYAIGYARGNAEADQNYNNDYQLLADPRLDLGFGPLNNDRRQNLVLSGRGEVPGTHGLQFSGVYRWMTGTPISLYNSAVDTDQNGRLVDPLAAGNYCGTADQNVFCTDNAGGRNGARGPSFHQMDMRATYRLRPTGGTTLDLNFELYNIFNTANFDNPTGDMRSTDFLVLTALRGGNGQPRAAELSLRLGY